MQLWAAVFTWGIKRRRADTRRWWKTDVNHRGLEAMESITVNRTHPHSRTSHSKLAAEFMAIWKDIGESIF